MVIPTFYFLYLMNVSEKPDLCLIVSFLPHFAIPNPTSFFRFLNQHHSFENLSRSCIVIILKFVLKNIYCLAF